MVLSAEHVAKPSEIASTDPVVTNPQRAVNSLVTDGVSREKTEDEATSTTGTVLDVSGMGASPGGAQLGHAGSGSDASEQVEAGLETGSVHDVIIVGEPAPVAVEEGPSVDNEEDGEDEADEEDEEDDEDLSDGEDLREDIRTTLSALDIEGTYAASCSFAQAPNPGLVIEGVGVIGLPLSLIDADRIAFASTQAPFGQGTQTVVDPTVRHTWEVEARRVSFYTPAWQAFVKDAILGFVVKALGITHSLASLRCELYKLLLYVPGSHFLAHQDTPKADGMFATVVVLLPSFYSGGEVQVSHAGKSKVLGFPPESMLHTNVLAWYTDVVHSVAPVQTGYRLALSYNLILSSANAPKPQIPLTDEAMTKLRRVLRKWDTGRYPDDPQYLAYLLDYEYSAVELGRGVKGLKGSDAQIVANLYSVAQEMGYLVFMAKLTYSRIGEASGDSDFNMYSRGRHASKRPRWGNYGEDDDEDDGEDGSDDSNCPSLEHDGMETQEMKISNMVDLDGNLVTKKGAKEFGLDEGQLVPENFFEDADPDRRKYQGYMGNEPGSVEYWYYNSVLVLIQYSTAAWVLGSAYALDYAISRLKQIHPSALTRTDREIMENAAGLVQDGTKKQVRELTEVALTWRDLFMWKRIYERNGTSPIDGNLYPEALGVFGFKAICWAIEQVLANKKELSDRLDIIQLVSTHSRPEDGLSPDAISSWCRAQQLIALETVQHVKVEDIPLIIQLTNVAGISKTMTSVLPALKQPGVKSDVWVALLKGIHQGKTSANVDKPDHWDEFIPPFLDTAIDLWTSENATRQIPSESRSNVPSAPLPEDLLVDSTAKLVDLVLTLNHENMPVCWRVLEPVLKAKGDVPRRFKSLYIPLMTKLRQVLAAHNMPITATPFAGFACGLIGLYLRDILGSRGNCVETASKKIGCGCNDCKALDAFITSQDKFYRFRASKARRSHMESRLIRVKDMVTFKTITDKGTPHILLVTKQPSALPEFQWSIRRKQAMEFLELFGDMESVRELMGDRALDVTRALDGVEAFLWVVHPMKPSSLQFSVPPLSRVTPKGGPSSSLQAHPIIP
ncbi:hypothetical protein BDN72DRAFT_801494 [Pluteus cervinus]|uniref:Uncharacterized protein n=1 Tax=Pluteus cervinus TaxID=181527 RepID=A0ACD3AIU8_9AGAR|nr:hypothetical protein BDN72DRAFT_801494 [Pluteus cervinus]